MVVAGPRGQGELGLEVVPKETSYLGDASVAENRHAPIHRWVPWIAGFSGQFVRDVIDTYLPEHGRENAVVLDPFTGVGTTLVEALKAGCNTIGYEINPFAALAASLKVNCMNMSLETLEAEMTGFRRSLEEFEDHVDKLWSHGGDNGLIPLLAKLRVGAPRHFKSRIPFFSPPVEAKVLHALAEIRTLPDRDRAFFLVALGAQLVSVSNYTYEPSLSSRPGADKPLIPNTSVLTAICGKLDEMLTDIKWAQSEFGHTWSPRQRMVTLGSYFASTLEPSSIDVVVTSPPYMNNYHYARNTRPHLHWLQLISELDDLRRYENESFGKFWQRVRQSKRIDLNFESSELTCRVNDLRQINADRGAYGGPGWANYVATYLNDSSHFLAVLGQQLAPGGHAVVVVGNSIIQGMEFKVDQILAEMAEQKDLRVEEVRIMRTKRVGNSIVNSSVRNGVPVNRKATQLYDAAVVLQRKQA